MTRPPWPWVATGFGALMVAAAGRPSEPWGLVLVGLAAVAVGVAPFFRPAAVAAAALSIAAIALGDSTALFAALSGLSAAAYLVIRYADGPPAVTLTVPTVVAMVVFTVAGVVATAIGPQGTWIVLLAPAIVAAILIAVAAPLISGTASVPAPGTEPSD